ncbi:unnamed protein product, partial [Amoebophrya sp. A25]
GGSASSSGPGANPSAGSSGGSGSSSTLLSADALPHAGHASKEQMLNAMLERARYFAHSQLAVQRVVFGKEITSLCYQMLSCEQAYQHLIQPYLSKLAWDPEADVR